MCVSISKPHKNHVNGTSALNTAYVNTIHNNKITQAIIWVYHIQLSKLVLILVKILSTTSAETGVNSFTFHSSGS
jgi:hypothetical protein